MCFSDVISIVNGWFGDKLCDIKPHTQPGKLPLKQKMTDGRVVAECRTASPSSPTYTSPQNSETVQSPLIFTRTLGQPIVNASQY